MTSLLRLLTGQPQAAPRAVSRETVAIVLANGRSVDVLRVRDPRARRIKLSVDERGPRLTLPLRASEIAGTRFVIEHGDWLLAQIAHAGTDAPGLQPHVTATLPLRGAEVPLRWRNARYLRIHADDPVADSTGDSSVDSASAVGIDIAAPETVALKSLQRALRDFYEGQARADVGRWLPKYLPELPRAPSRLRYRVMSSQWGSLAPDGALSLDLSLVLAPPAAFEYVLVHELCHLIHADHSRAFWREVERRCPQWRDQREYFRASGRALKARLRKLIAAED